MAKRPGMALGVAAIVIYILGGIGTFGGLALMAFMKERSVLGWGSGWGIGLLSLCVGCALSVAAVLMMRIFRNRGLV